MERQIWERREGESSARYKAFAGYRDLGPRRTMLAAYELYRPTWSPKGKREAPGHFRQWAIDGEWKRRVAAYDAHHSREALERNAERRRQAQEVFAEHVVTVAKRVVLHAAGMLAEAVEKDGFPGPKTMTKTQLRACEIALDRAGVAVLTRLEVSGPNGGPVQYETGDYDLSKLSTNEIEQMRLLSLKARVK